MASLREKIAALESRAFTYANALYIRRDDVLAIIEKHERIRASLKYYPEAHEDRSAQDARTILAGISLNAEILLSAIDRVLAIPKHEIPVFDPPGAFAIQAAQNAIIDAVRAALGVADA